MATVTIGMPVYNGAVYLNEALTAICAQSFQDLQIIISDNASTDETPAIIANWAGRDSRIVHTHRQTKNIGAFANFEWVLNAADTTWFMFAAHDDKWSPNYVQSLFETISKKSELKLAAPQIIYMQEDGQEKKRRLFPLEVLEGESGISKIRKLLRVGCGSWFYGLYRCEDLKKSWELNKNYTFPWAHDLLILLPFFLSGCITGTNDAHYYVRETKQSVLNYKPQSFGDQRKVYLSFLRHSLKAHKNAGFSCWEYLALYPSIFRFVSSHAVKLRRMARSAFKAIYDKSAR